jgi:CheY-like chemotaxis protein
MRLVVDDDAEVRDTIDQMLNVRGLHTLTAADQNHGARPS